jgi:hypothetical protein
MAVRRKSPAAAVIAAAAQPILAPLGCRQKGHSLVWIADQRFFLIHLEFAASGFGAPTCVTVGTYWLWYAQSALSFDYGTRLTEFAPFRDAEQFAPVARDMAMRAAAEIAAIRAKFRSVSDVARHLAEAGGDGYWPLYHTAVAAALAGHVAAAQNIFRRLAEKPASREWEATLQADASALARCLPDTAAFRAAAIDVINRSRALQGLRADSDCLGG